ncbi:MAG: phosphate ABC transporter permease PstA [Phycisphaeraceae bacterium]|nr:phosphate ABC transporter permease PstA [Phycisphaeraceae bacterium]
MATLTDAHISGIARRRRIDLCFAVAGAVVLTLALGVLVALVTNLAKDGAARLGWDFLTSFPSRRAGDAGVKSAIVGTALVMFVTACTAIPLGIAAGLYLEEYARKNWFTAIVEINIANLAGVPSIIWGLMALGLFVYWMNLGRSILTAGLTLGLLVLPIVIVATREAVRAIPQIIREASYACGATRLQTVWHHILPYSLSGIITGSIIALSRAIGETAPLITIGALTYIAFLPPPPFGERPWHYDVESRATFDTAQRTQPLEDVSRDISGSHDSPTPSLRDGEITFAWRLDPGTPITQSRLSLPLSSGSMSLSDLVSAIDADENLAATISRAGRLRITADAPGEDPGEFCITNDTTGLIEAFSIAPGGGRYGATDWIMSEFTVLPIQMFNWVSRPDSRFQVNAAATGLVLLTLTLMMNGIAIWLRYRLRRSISW